MGSRILVIDDDQQVRSLLRRVLTADGYDDAGCSMPLVDWAITLPPTGSWPTSTSSVAP